MQDKPRLVIASILILVFTGTRLFAQWNTDPAVNTTVSVQQNDQQEVRIVSDGFFGAITTWVDFRSGSGHTNGDIYAQRTNRSGYNLWTGNGAPVCTNSSDQSGVVMTFLSNATKCAIIAWVDMRNGNRDIYAQRIDSSGNVQWTGDGVPVAVKPNTQQDLHIIWDGNDGAIIVWQDSANGAWDIYAQHLDGAGNATWTAGGVSISSAPLYQINPKMTDDGFGGALITWQDYRNGNDYNIYAQRVNAAGVVSWTTNGVAICTVAGTQSNPKIRDHGAAESVIAWQDKRFGNDYDIYSQGVDSSGVIQWTANGVIICNAAGNQSALDMTNEATPGIMIAWKDERSGNNDIYAQLVNSIGSPQWASNGVAIATGSAPQINPNIVGDVDADQGAIIVWQDSTAGNWDVKAQRISGSGIIQWAANGVSVGIAADDQEAPKNFTSGWGECLFAWNDKRNGNDYDIYIHRLFADGTSLGIKEQSMLSESSLYPNPVSSNAVIRWKSREQNIILKIFSTEGVLVRYESYSGVNEAAVRKNELSSGIYFYEIISDDDNAVLSKGKFVIAD